MSDERPAADGEIQAIGEGLAPGSMLAGYRLAEPIGQGGMAVVFRAHDERLGRLVAMKVLAPALAADEGYRQRFIRESRAAAAVDDPHIIPVYEAGEAAGFLFIVMRYVAGGDVRSLLRRNGHLSAARAAAIVSPVASALDAAHSRGLIHRDVKPSNMLLDTRAGRPDHVYLSDFGLSKQALSSAGLTDSAQLLGTPDYLSPEQIAGHPVDGKADQYALACAAFELLSGTPPFQRDHPLTVIYAHSAEPPPRLTAHRPELPHEADAVLAKALAKDPGDRYPTCGDFAESLRVAMALQPYAIEPGTSHGEHPVTVAVWPPGSRPASAGTSHSPESDAPAGTGKDADNDGASAGADPSESKRTLSRGLPAMGSDQLQTLRQTDAARHRPTLRWALGLGVPTALVLAAILIWVSNSSAPTPGSHPRIHSSTTLISLTPSASAPATAAPVLTPPPIAAGYVPPLADPGQTPLPTGAVVLGSVNLGEYCRGLTPSGYAVLRYPNVGGWRCSTSPAAGMGNRLGDLSISVAGACEDQYGQAAKPHYRNYYDPHSWFCFRA